MRIRIFRAVIAFLILTCGSVAAESLPLRSVNKAGEVIDAAIEAHGGAGALNGIKTIVQKSEFTNFRTGQSRRPGPPYDQGHQVSFSAIDLENERFVTRNSGEGGGYVFDQGTIINGENSWHLNHRSGTAVPVEKPDFNTRSGPFIRVTPALLMKQLLARRQQSNWLGEADLDGRMHDVITLVMETGPTLGLYIDRDTHMLTRMERVVAPFGQIEYHFLDYGVIGGIAFNRKFRLYANGVENLTIDIRKTKVNEPLDPFLELSDSLRKVTVSTDDKMSSQEIGEGVFLVGGNNTYVMFVEMEDHVVAVGGTDIVAASIEELRKKVPEKPVRYGVLTHHHDDHIPGAAAYAAEGSIIVIFKENEEVVRTAAASDDLKLEFVRDHMALSDGKRKIELYNVGPTPHAENNLIAYLPDQGIIFEADHFPQPATGVIPPAVPVTVAFARALDRLGLDYQKLVGAHSPRVASPADLETSLTSKPASVVGGR